MLFVGQPVESLLRSEALRKCDPEAGRERSDALQEFLQNRVPRRIQLADKFLRLQLGGGFLQIQGDRFFLVERDRLAPTQPGCLDLCSGVFDAGYSTPLETMIAEASELLRLSSNDNEVVFPSFSVGTRPLPENTTLSREIDTLVDLMRRDGRPIVSKRTTRAEIVVPPGSAWLADYACPDIPVRVSIEPASCSLEVTAIARLDPGVFKYADGEIQETSDGKKMLNRRIYEFSLREHTYTVWQNFQEVSHGQSDMWSKIKRATQFPPLTEKALDILQALWEPLPAE
jgi:hypothetical protein